MAPRVSSRVCTGVGVNSALAEIQLTVPGTEGLPPSGELLYFDPVPRSRRVVATPLDASPHQLGLLADKFDI